MLATIFLTKEEVKDAISDYLFNSLSYQPANDPEATMITTVEDIQFLDEMISVNLTCEKEGK